MKIFTFKLCPNLSCYYGGWEGDGVGVGLGDTGTTVREDFSEEVTFRLRPWVRVSLGTHCREGPAGAKSLRQDRAWCNRLPPANHVHLPIAVNVHLI